MEKIEITPNQPYAGFWLRFAAYLLDSVILSFTGALIAVPAIIVIVSTSIGLSNIKQPEDLLLEGNLLKISIIVGTLVLIGFFSLIISWLYFALMESSSFGGTLGKIAVGIKVTTIDGERVTFARASGRYFAKIITNMTFFIGYIIAGFTEKKQALHDFIASCLVIKK